MLCRVVSVLLLLSPLSVAAPVPKSLKSTTASPDGVWKLVEFWSNGQKGNIVGMTSIWVLDGEAFYVGPKVEANYWQLTSQDRTDPLARRFAHGRMATSTHPARLMVEGDTLRFCYGFDTSSEITECSPARNVHYYVFTRLSPDDPAATAALHPPK
ncbi:MAG: hypothetical protein MUF18_10080 [Fimbriiglobus sp.]|jgi:hypothetical protein|nr:hypothetical protein [Fimbriiglobus sp.]